MEKGVPIRSISRSIAVLQVMNRHRSVTLTDVAKASGLPYPTVCRIVQTLIHEGLVDASPESKHYHVTSMVQSLSVGYKSQGHLIESARPTLLSLTGEFGWPVAITTPVGGEVMIQDSTFDISSLALSRYPAGYTLPMLSSAPGHVHLAFTDEKTRACFFKGMEELRHRSLTLDMFRSGKLTDRIRQDGFALDDRSLSGHHPRKTSSLSVPIMQGRDKAAELTLTYFSATMTAKDAIRRFVAPLQKASEDIVGRLADSEDAGSYQRLHDGHPAASGRAPTVPCDDYRKPSNDSIRFRSTTSAYLA